MGKIIGIVFAVLVLFGVASGCSNYNNLVQLDEAVGRSYSQIQVVMQRQSDLIPNLVETVRGYADREKDTFVQVSQARAQLSEVAKLDPTKLANDPALQKKLIEAQANSQRAFVSLNAVRESYPELKSNTLFQNLMNSIEGSVNRVSTERRANLAVIQNYNQVVRQVPGAVWAWLFGFKAKPQFQASDEAQTMPKVKF